MITPTHPNPSRRLMIAWLSGVGVMGSVYPAAAIGERNNDPVDRVPHYFGIRRFLALGESDIYMVHLAQRRGRRIMIQGFSASESRDIIRRARQDWPSTRRALQQSGN